MSDRVPDPRTARQLERLAGGAWRVQHDERLHHVDGPAGAFAIAEAGDVLRPQAGEQLVVAVWDDFPEEVREAGGVFYVQGEHLVDFLLAQPPGDWSERYEICDRHWGAAEAPGHTPARISEEGR